MRSGAFEGIHHLLPAGSADEVLQTGSIHEAKLPSCQAFIVYFKYLNCTFFWVVEIRNQRQYSGHNTPLGHHSDRDPLGLGQYCASYVFLILFPFPGKDLKRLGLTLLNFDHPTFSITV